MARSHHPYHPYEPRPGSIPTLTVPEIADLRSAHLIGIGGAGMSGVARLLLARGVAVSGSDLKDSRGLQALRRAGADVSVGHRAEQVGAPDAVVISTAIPPGNPELLEARRRDIPVWARAQVLAALAAGRRTLAVAGTHGKTTTTSMLSLILGEAGLDPSYVIGGDVNEIGSGARHGGGDLFVAEADESDGSFLLLHPEVAVVTNVEEDHLDFYRGGREEIVAAFGRFMDGAEHVVACGDDDGVRDAIGNSNGRTTTYGVSPGNDVSVRPSPQEPTGVAGTVDAGDGPVDVCLPVRGIHNLLNAAAAIVAAGRVGVSADRAARVLRSFTGVRRRFEYRGTARGADFFDDYAHHPTEVVATLQAPARDGGGRLIAVFQPHLYTRTQAMWRAFGESLAGADLVVVTDVYAARESPIPGVTGKLIVDAVATSAPGKRLLYLPHPSDVVGFLVDEVRKGDTVLTLGAGDITMVAEETLERIREAS